MVNIESFEDSSVSSTFDVKVEMQRPKATTELHRIRSPRLVSFNESQNVVYEMFRDDPVSLWWSQNELQEFKKNYIQAIKEVIRDEREYKKDAMSYQRVFARVYKSCCRATGDDDNNQVICELRPEDHGAFDKWVSVTASRTGLECVVHRKLYQDRSMRRHELVEVIESWQIAAAAHSSCDNNQIADIIALASRDISRPSRLFALYLGLAQAKAVHV